MHEKGVEVGHGVRVPVALYGSPCVPVTAVLWRFEAGKLDMAVPKPKSAPVSPAEAKNVSPTAIPFA